MVVVVGLTGMVAALVRLSIALAKTRSVSVSAKERCRQTRKRIGEMVCLLIPDV